MRERFAALLVGLVPAWACADPLPMPKTDFSATYAVTGSGAAGSTMTIRHAGGKIRLEIAAPGGVAATGYLDLASKKALMVMALPGAGQPIGMEMDAAMLPKALTAPEGRRLGPQRFGGEACDAWEHTEAGGMRTVSCIAPDGLLIRAESRKGADLVALIEATAVSRTKQDPAQLAPPANIQIMKMPAGLIPGLKMQ